MFNKTKILISIKEKKFNYFKVIYSVFYQNNNNLSTKIPNKNTLCSFSCIYLSFYDIYYIFN